MASVILPIVAPIIAEELPVAVKGLTELIVRGIDKLFPKKSGPLKLATATATTTAILTGLSTAKAIPAIPPAASVTAGVQALVDSLNSKGQLLGADTVLVPAGSSASPQVLAAAVGIQMMLAGLMKVIEMQTALQP